MKRRDFTLALSTAIMATASGARAVTGMKHLAVFGARSSNGRQKGDAASFLASENLIAKRLRELGWGAQNLRAAAWGSMPGDRKAREQVAAQVVDSRPDVIWANGWRYVKALQGRTKSIPIVSALSDPVLLGFARSERASGSNVTGVSNGVGLSLQRALELMRLLQPRLRTMHGIASGKPMLEEVSGDDPIETWFRDQGLITSKWPDARAFERAVGSGPIDRMAAITFIDEPEEEDIRRVVEISKRKQMLAINIGPPGFALEGGLLDVWMAHQDTIEGRLGTMIDKMLRGADPATMPWEMPNLAILWINLATARAIGVEVPRDWLLRADRVIE